MRARFIQPAIKFQRNRSCAPIPGHFRRCQLQRDLLRAIRIAPFSFQRKAAREAMAEDIAKGREIGNGQR